MEAQQTIHCFINTFGHENTYFENFEVIKHPIFQSSEKYVSGD